MRCLKTREDAKQHYLHRVIGKKNSIVPLYQKLQKKLRRNCVMANFGIDNIMYLKNVNVELALLVICLAASVSS